MSGNMYVDFPEESKFIGNSVYKLFDKLEYGKPEIRIFEIYNDGDTFESNYIDFNTYGEAKEYFDKIQNQREVVSKRFGGEIIKFDGEIKTPQDILKNYGGENERNHKKD